MIININKLSQDISGVTEDGFVYDNVSKENELILRELNNSSMQEKGYYLFFFEKDFTSEKWKELISGELEE